MTNFDDKLRTLRAQAARKKQLRAMLDTLYARRGELEARERELAAVRAAEPVSYTHLSLKDLAMSFICEDTEPMPIRHLTESSLSRVSSIEVAILIRSLTSLPALTSLTTTMSVSEMCSTKSFCLSGNMPVTTSIAATSAGICWRTRNTTRGTSLPKCSSRDLM